MVIDFDGKTIISKIEFHFFKVMSMMTLTLSLAPVQALIMDVASHLWTSTGTSVIKIRLK